MPGDFVGSSEVTRIDAAERARQIAKRVSDPTKRIEITSREKGYKPPESNVSYGITRSTIKKDNVVSGTTVRINAAERAKQIAKKVSNSSNVGIPTSRVKVDPAKRSEILSREKGYRPPESNVSYGITRSVIKDKEKNSNIISETSTPHINAAERARELRLKRELEYAQRFR